MSAHQYPKPLADYLSRIESTEHQERAERICLLCGQGQHKFSMREDGIVPLQYFSHSLWHSVRNGHCHKETDQGEKQTLGSC